MKKLILNADDFGLSESVNQAVVESFRNGMVRSTSLLVNFPASSGAFELAKQHDLDLGWHLNLVEGKPVTPPNEIRSLVDPSGNFLKPRVFLQRAQCRRLKVLDLEREISAQWSIFERNNLLPSHVDGHMHMHVMPQVRDVLRKVLPSKLRLHVRIPRERGVGQSRFLSRAFISLQGGTREAFWSSVSSRPVAFYGISLFPQAGSLMAWEKILDAIREPVAEIMVHPQKPQGEAHASGDNPRHGEYGLLVGSALKEKIRAKGFELSCFREISME